MSIGTVFKFGLSSYREHDESCLPDRWGIWCLQHGVGRVIDCKCIDRSVDGTLYEIVQDCFRHGWGWIAPLDKIVSDLDADIATLDKVNPQHYKQGGLEAIDVIEALGLDFHRGNAIKYLLRAGKKTGEAERTDLEKALWYIERAIKALK